MGGLRGWHENSSVDSAIRCECCPHCWGVRDPTAIVAAGLRSSAAPGVNWSGCDLTEIILDADLTGADLTGANFYDVSPYMGNFTGANLSGAYLGYTDFRGANLTGANLTGATGVPRSTGRAVPLHHLPRWAPSSASFPYLSGAEVRTAACPRNQLVRL